MQVHIPTIDWAGWLGFLSALSVFALTAAGILFKLYFGIKNELADARDNKNNDIQDLKDQLNDHKIDLASAVGNLTGQVTALSNTQSAIHQNLMATTQNVLDMARSLPAPSDSSASSGTTTNVFAEDATVDTNKAS